jgi:enoyl-CoA hydratase/carnithine racemase
MRPSVTVERDGAGLVIGINRPHKRNAFDGAMIVELAKAYEQLDGDRELRAALLFGHGDHFSAGLDLADVRPCSTRTVPPRSPATARTTPSANGSRPSTSRW